MAYDLDTADEVRRSMKQCPGDLKVFVYKYGEYRPVEKIRTCYAVLCKSESGFKYYKEVEKHTTGAIQILAIE